VADRLFLKDILIQMEEEGAVAEAVEGAVEGVATIPILITTVHMTAPIMAVQVIHISTVPRQPVIMRTDLAKVDTVMTAVDMAEATKVRNLRSQHFLYSFCQLGSTS
jgi:hypothetical protein